MCVCCREEVALDPPLVPWRPTGKDGAGGIRWRSGQRRERHKDRGLGRTRTSIGGRWWTWSPAQGGSAAGCFADGSPRGDGCAIETMRAALNALAVTAPDWLCGQAGLAWVERYGQPADDYRIPQGDAARRTCAEGVGRDGDALLAAVAAPDAPAWLREVPAVRLLRRVWMQNFCLVPAKAGDGRGTDGPGEDGLLVRWRTTVEGFPTSLLMIASPYDPEVHSRPTPAAHAAAARGTRRVLTTSPAVSPMGPLHLLALGEALADHRVDYAFGPGREDALAGAEPLAVVGPDPTLMLVANSGPCLLPPL